jgi:hypothetical protein
MNIKILQSIAAGIISLSLIASCSNLLPKKESQTCGGKDGCNSTKNETIKKEELEKKVPTKVEKKHSKKSKKSKKSQEKNEIKN